MFANYEKKIIEMTKSESKSAGKVGTTEYEMLKELRSENPTFRIVIKASKSRDNMKGLTVAYMKKYIEAHDDAEKTNMTIFNALRGLDADGKQYWADRGNGADSMEAIWNMRFNHGGVARKQAIPAINGIYLDTMSRLNDIICKSIEDELD